MPASESDMHRQLIEAAARLLAEEGPAALTTRRLTREVGASTMAVYTYFGGLPGLVRAVVREGFARLARHLAAVPRTSMTLTDLAQLALAYRANALENPHLYAVMFGNASLGGYKLSGEELDEGRYTLKVLVDATRRAMDAEVFRRDDAELVATQMWSAMHGFVALESSGYLQADAVEKVLISLLVNLSNALGAPALEQRVAAESIEDNQ